MTKAGTALGGLHPDRPPDRRTATSARPRAASIRIGRSFGILPSPRPGYLLVTEGTVCVGEPSSPHYNAITSRKLIAPNTRRREHGPGFPIFRRGLVVGYPTGGEARAGSCIFIHARRSPTSGTSGSVSVPRAPRRGLAGFCAPLAPSWRRRCVPPVTNVMPPAGRCLNFGLGTVCRRRAKVRPASAAVVFDRRDSSVGISMGQILNVAVVWAAMSAMLAGISKG